jgi:hypothetical protein
LAPSRAIGNTRMDGISKRNGRVNKLKDNDDDWLQGL